MTVVLEQHLPVPLAMIEEVSAHMGVVDNPPDGLIVHVATEEAGGTRILDIWESQADYEAFAATRLGPAVQTVAAAHGMDPSEGEAPTFTEAFDVVRGK